MPENELMTRERQLLANLKQLVQERSQAEKRVASLLHQLTNAAEEEHQTRLQQAETKIAADAAEIEKWHAAEKVRIETQLTQQMTAAETQHDESCDTLANEISLAEEEAKRKLEEARWEGNTVYEATRHKPQETYDELLLQIDASVERLQKVQQQVQLWLHQNRK